MMKPPEAPKVKDPFLMQTFFKDNVPVNEAIFHLQVHVKQREERLDKIKYLLESRWKDIKQRDVMKPRIVLSFAVLKRGLESEMNYIKWCEETIQLLEDCAFLWEKNEKKQQHYTKDDELVEYTASASYQDLETVFEDYLFKD